MTYPTLLLRYLSCLVLLAFAPAAQAEKLVVVRSAAASDYLEKRMADGKRQPQSYVFMAGRYFAGNTHDNSLHKTSFRTIAERLAMDLQHQDYYPAASLPKADLLLMVHWGVTTGSNRDAVAVAMGMENLTTIHLAQEESQRDFDVAIAAGDLEGAGRARDHLEALAKDTKSEHQSIRFNQYSGGEDSAALLGLSAELQKDDYNPFGSERRKALIGMTEEERYFVIVMAYDAPTLLSTKKMKRVWTMRASIRSAGVNFHQALDRIGNIASNYFGTRQDGVTFEHTGDREYKTSVKLGDLIVLGTVEP